LGFGIGVSDYGFRVSGCGFRVPCLGFRVSGYRFGFRVRASGFSFRFSGFGFRVSGFKFRVRVSCFTSEVCDLVREAKSRFPWTLPRSFRTGTLPAMRSCPGTKTDVTNCFILPIGRDQSIPGTKWTCSVDSWFKMEVDNKFLVENGLGQLFLSTKYGKCPCSREGQQAASPCSRPLCSRNN
jgi:hypothetical protein